MSKMPKNELYVAAKADTSEDSQVLKENIINLMIEEFVENCRYNSQGPVEFICADADKTLVENEVISQVEDQILEDDCHLIRIRIIVEAEYL